MTQTHDDVVAVKGLNSGIHRIGKCGFDPEYQWHTTYTLSQLRDIDLTKGCKKCKPEGLLMNMVAIQPSFRKEPSKIHRIGKCAGYNPHYAGHTTYTIATLRDADATLFCKKCLPGRLLE